MSQTSWRDLYNLGAISAISASSWQSRRDGRYLATISSQSRRDLESNKHHGEISARSRRSRRELANLNFARVQLHSPLYQEPITWSVQLPYFRATAFSQVELFLDMPFLLKLLFLVTSALKSE